MTGSGRSVRSEAAAQPRAAQLLALHGTELTLDQLLAEPIVQQLMRRDATDEATIRRLLQTAATARAAPKLRFIQSAPRAGEDTIAWLLHDTARLWRKRCDRAVRAEIPGMTCARCAVLVHLAQRGGINQATLARILHIKPITLARLLDRLEAAGLIARMADPGDRRAHVLALTARALPIVDRIYGLARKVHDEAQRGVSRAAADRLVALLGRVSSNLSAPTDEVSSAGEHGGSRYWGRVAPMSDACETHGASKITGWLVGDECHELDFSGLVKGLGRKLRAGEIPVDRLVLHMRTLHPLIRGRIIAWAPNEPVEVFELQHGANTSEQLNDPVYHVVSAREWLSLRLDDRQTSRWSTPSIFLNRKLTQLLIAPLLNAGPFASAATFGTTQATGFSDSQRALLQAIVPALRSASELKLLHLVEATLLSAYVGTVAAQRILAGHVRRGDVEALEAALMVCDLRGFTVLSNHLPEGQVLELLNTYFDQVVPAIEDAGGEVLKFMGDAVLAYFHHEDGAAASCAVAFDAARTALARLAMAANASGALHAGIALHYGKVSYGNIGSGKRLDFTVIGRDVNLVSRIQGICALTGRPLLMSERFADLLAASHTLSIGRHELKGFGEPAELFASAIIDASPGSEVPERIRTGAARTAIVS